jgi:hypothetical protein
MKLLAIEPIEPLSLTSIPITGVKIFSTVSPLPIPLPTTVIGAIGVLLNIKLTSNDPINGIRELISEVKDKLRCREPTILGPLTQFKVRGLWSEPTILISDKNLFITPDLIKDHELILDECKPNKCFEFQPLIAIGTALKRGTIGEEKSVRLGYMYRYPLLTYRTLEGDAVEPRFVYIINCEGDIGGVIRFGGEGRIAKIYTLSGNGFEEYIKNVVNPLNISVSGFYIALNHIPLLSTSNTLDTLYLDSVIGLEFTGGVRGVIGLPQNKKPPKVIVERLGLGYYEVLNIRRPQILTLPPGTIVRVVAAGEISSKLLSTLYDIGFASLYSLTFSK